MYFRFKVCFIQKKYCPDYLTYNTTMVSGRSKGSNIFYRTIFCRCIFHSRHGGFSGCQFLLFSWIIWGSFFLWGNFLKSYVLRCLGTRDATSIYQFIANNQASFHLWWKENLLNNQKVSEYYEHGSLQNFILFFMSLLTPSVVKSSHILDRVYFVALKERPRPNLKDFRYQIWTLVKRLGK